MAGAAAPLGPAHPGTDGRAPRDLLPLVRPTVLTAITSLVPALSGQFDRASDDRDPRDDPLLVADLALVSFDGILPTRLAAPRKALSLLPAISLVLDVKVLFAFLF